MPARVFLALLIALLLLGALLTPFAAAQQIFPTFTPPPFIWTAVPQPTAANGCAAPLPLVVGATAYVSGGLFVRTQPNLSSPYVEYYEQAVTVTITDGPVCDGARYNWWKVSGPGNDGWVAEGQPGNYFISVGALPGEACGAAAGLTVGARAELLRDLRLRAAPSTAGLVLTVAPTGALAEVLEGPQCGDGYNWWRVRVVVLDVAYTGWMADAQPGGSRWLRAEGEADAPVCAPPLNLAIGSRAYVDYADRIPKNMRALPTEAGELVATLLDGIGFEVIGGPVCAEGYNWWQIRILSRPDVSGWLAEGGPQGYWIAPLRTQDRPV